jgi:diguanylate cyclase (GGDEF)-like protein
LCVRRPAARTRGFSECYGEERTIVENAGLGIYAIISKWGFPKTYRGKIMLVAFLGIHAPLLGAALYLLLGSSVGLTKPDLPLGFSDEVGRLMADVRYAVEHLDSTIRSLEGLSGTDHLTDLPNRREGEDRLANDIARARRGGGHLTVAVVDLDDFKTINDTHGHHAGDVCIRHVADVIGRSVREGDWLSRWGGDEFVLALWDDSVFASPEAVLGRINAELRRTRLRLPGGEELVLSISVGAHRYAGEEDLRELLAKADGAMYQAKREGRAWVLAD